MSGKTQIESPFQVVTQKRPSGQARKLSNRDRPPVPRSGGQSDEGAPTISSSTTMGGGGRKRHSREGGGRQHSGSKSGAGSVQGRGREVGEGEGEGGGGRGHTNRHSWDPETAQSMTGGSFSRGGISEKIERSQSARFDRGTPDTNNRFERLNPDTEAPGDQSVKPSPAAGGGGGRGRKRNSRSVSGGCSYRSKSPKRRSGKEGGGKGGGEREGTREKESAAVVSCELEWDSGTQESHDVVVNGGSSPVKESVLGKQGSVELAPVDKTSGGASAQGGEGGCVEEEVCPAGDSGEGVEQGEGEKERKVRVTYTRNELLVLKDHALSLKKPDILQGKYFRQGKWCADAWLTPQPTNEEKDELEEGEAGETGPGKTLPKLKNPTTLSIIREHDVKGYGKVCLSPQRRSFGSGCSWNTSATGSGRDGQSSATSNHRDGPFDSHAEPRRLSGSRSGGFQSHSHPNHAHMSHASLRDQKGWKGDGGRAGEREKGRSYGGYKNREIEEEPEWMSFGPSDRSEVIELVGLDEHERGRDAKEEEHGDRDSTVVCEEGREGGSEGGRGEGVSEEEGSTKTSESSVGVEEGVVGVVRPVMGGGGAGENRNEAPKEPENEFMLDGFDFSTSVSICQALESDEEEEESVSGRGRGVTLLPRAVSDPNELSSALMKALRVGEEAAYRHTGGHPANALTLEEVHERENIAHTSRTPSSYHEAADQSAFNRLVAVLQSSGAIQDEPPQPQKLPRPPVPLAMPHRQQEHSLSGRLASGRGLEPGSFGYMLEKEMRFDEDFGSSSSSHLLPRAPPMTHHREHPHMGNPSLMRESYGSHAKPIFTAPHHHQAPPLSGHALHDKWVERSWIHPEATPLDYGGLQRPPVDPLGPPMVHHPHPHHHSGRQVGPMGGGRPPNNSWLIEVEQRRRMELQSMRERGIRVGGAGGGDLLQHHHALPSKPNISLLPTAVMRQLHNSKPTHSLSDIASRPSPADRLDQDVGGRSAYPYGYLEGLGGGRAEYPYPATHSRVPPRPQYRGGGAMGLYAPPPQFLPMPHGMSSQPQNPYLH